MCLGLGCGMVAVSVLCCVYYNMIIAYSIRYLVVSFTSELPWQHCWKSWPEELGCLDRDVNKTHIHWMKLCNYMFINIYIYTNMNHAKIALSVMLYKRNPNNT